MLLGTSCSSDHHDGGGRSDDASVARTVLVYMVAENSLSSVVYDDIREMLEANEQMSANDHLVVYVDNSVLPRIYHIDRKTSAETMMKLTPVKTYTQDMNSADAQTLSEILAYTIKNYPADEYGLVMWSHASGWVPSTYTESQAPRRRSFGIDNGQNTTDDWGPQMEIGDMASALSAFPKLKFILFDACFMQSMEVAYELKDCAEWLIGSAAEIPASGAPYEKIVGAMFADPFSAAAVARNYYEYYADDIYGSLLSAIDCSQMDAFGAYVANLMRANQAALDSADLIGVLNYYDYDALHEQLAIPDQYDLRGMMRKVLSESDFAAFDKQLQAVCTAYATKAWWSGLAQAQLTCDSAQYGGISAYWPQQKYAAENFYDYYKTTRWAKYLNR